MPGGSSEKIPRTISAIIPGDALKESTGNFVMEYLVKLLGNVKLEINGISAKHHESLYGRIRENPCLIFYGNPWSFCKKKLWMIFRSILRKMSAIHARFSIYQFRNVRDNRYSFFFLFSQETSENIFFKKSWHSESLCFLKNSLDTFSD